MRCTNKVSQFTNNITQNRVCIFKCAIIKFKNYVRYITARLTFNFLFFYLFLFFFFFFFLFFVQSQRHIMYIKMMLNFLLIQNRFKQKIIFKILYDNFLHYPITHYLFSRSSLGTAITIYCDPALTSS